MRIERNNITNGLEDHTDLEEQVLVHLAQRVRRKDHLHGLVAAAGNEAAGWRGADTPAEVRVGREE